MGSDRIQAHSNSSQGRPGPQSCALPPVRGRRAPRPRRRTHRHQDRSIVASDQGWLKSSALLTFPADGAGLCRAWLRERLAGSPAYRARSSAVTVSTTASRMPNVTFNQNERPADADKTSDITISLLLDRCSLEALKIVASQPQTPASRDSRCRACTPDALKASAPDALHEASQPQTPASRGRSRHRH